MTLDDQVDVSGTVYFELGYNHSLLSKAKVRGTGQRSALLEIVTQPTLSLGEHSGRIDLYVCKSSSCAEYYSSTPATLSYRITVTQAPPSPPAATITPTSVTQSVESGDYWEVSITADIHGSLVGDLFDPMHFGVVDAQGLFSATPTWTPAGIGRYSVKLIGVPTKAPGTYRGTLQLAVCYASPCTTASDAPGSPVPIEYTITVEPIALPPIPTITGLPEWETYQGNPAHTGYVPVILDQTRFTSGWSWASPFQRTALSPAATGLGLAVVSVYGGTNFPAYLVALNEGDGAIAWQHDFGTTGTMNHPAASAGRVFVSTTGIQETWLWSFELATGQEVFHTSFPSQGQKYLAPTFKDGMAYTGGGYISGVYAFKASSGLTRWGSSIDGYDLWSPAVDDTRAYVHIGYQLAALNRSTGAPEFTVPNAAFGSGRSMNTAPVIDTPDTIVAVDGVFDRPHANHLIRYRISGRSELWRADGSFASNPATAKGQIYVLNAAPNGLDVYDAASGTKLWSWTAPDAVPVGNLIVTNNLVFASTTVATYAIDIATHQPVWSTPRPGALALSSNGVLYIVAPQHIDTYELL